MKRIHIVGCHRSGTTLLFELMTTCFRHDAHCDHERSIFKDKAHCDGIYISKKPSDITHIEQIFSADPDLYLLYLIRDPRAVISSIHPSKSDRYFSSFERWQRYEQAAAPLKSHPRFLEVRYEDLVRHPDKVQSSICTRFSFLETMHPFSAFEKFAQTSKPAEISLKGIRAINDKSIDRWKEHLPRIKFQLERYPALVQCLIEYGYEQDDQWLTLVEDIKPKKQSYGESGTSYLKQKEMNLRYWLKGRSYLRRIKKSALFNS